MKLARIRELLGMVDRMSRLSPSSSAYQQLRYEIIPRETMPDILFLLECAEKVATEQKELL